MDNNIKDDGATTPSSVVLHSIASSPDDPGNKKVWRPRVREGEVPYAVNIDIDKAMDFVRVSDNVACQDFTPISEGGEEVVRLTIPGQQMHIHDLPEKLMLTVLSYIPHIELVKVIPRVCHKWRSLSYHGYLWRNTSVRPEYCGYYVSHEALLSLISLRFANQLRSIDLPCEHITVPVIHELVSRSPAVQRITLDFSKATQLYDFTDLNCFPSNLHALCICLSEVVFLEGFLRRVYSFLSSLKVLHLIGTLETSTGDEEIFEVVNIGKIRTHTPNLRVVNFYGVTFVDDSHIDMLASSCIHLEVLAINYCVRVKGSSLKLLLSRCKKLETLLLRHTNLKDEHVMAVDWSKCKHLSELDISCTDLSEATLMEVFMKLPPLTFLSAAHCDFFTDKILNMMFNNKKLERLRSVDLSYTCDLSDSSILNMINAYGSRLEGLMLHGKPKLDEKFWELAVPKLGKIRTLTLGTAFGWFIGNMARVHLDQIINNLCYHCPKLTRLEIQWEPDTLRFSDKSSKSIDLLRIRCMYLQSVTLADGEFYEMVKSNFERAGRPRIVRPTNRYQTSILSQLKHFNELLFN